MTDLQTIVEVRESVDTIEILSESVEVREGASSEATIVEVETAVEVIDKSVPDVVEMGVPGPRGGSVAAYRHSQGVAAAVWTIDHGMGFYPNVTVRDSSGREVEGYVTWPSADRVVITFVAAFGGEAYLS